MLPSRFLVGTKNVYLTTDHGLLIVIDILTGKTQSVLKLAKYMENKIIKTICIK